MNTHEAIKILRNTAWLGTNEDREKTEQAVEVVAEALEQEPLPCDIPKTFGIFIPEITVAEFRNAPLETIEDLLAMGEFHDIDLSIYQEQKCEDCRWNTWDNNCMVEYCGCRFEPKNGE